MKPRTNRNAYDPQRPIPGPGHRPKNRGLKDSRPLPMVTGNNDDCPQGVSRKDQFGNTVKANRYLGDDDGYEG